LEAPFFRTGRKRTLPGIAIAVGADRERVAAMAAFEQASPLLAARHGRPLALIEDE
jgi:hypothetical protein